MAHNEDFEELTERRICFKCVGEAYLSRQIEMEGAVARCSYCGDEDPGITLVEMSDRVATAFEQHYDRTSDQPSSMQYAMLKDKESDYEWDREGEPVDEAIASAASISEAAAVDIRSILAERFSDWDSAMSGEETEFDSESNYEPKDVRGGRWHAQWVSFERSLKTEARFFDQTAIRHLTELFNGIDRMVTRARVPVLVNAGPGASISSLYRARSFPVYRDIHGALARPDLQLGPPPAAAARAGRMNARGISVFYGANDPLVALAEVRPPVGCTVVVARFEIIRAIKLLNLTALRDAMMEGSIFDPLHLDRLQRAAFLRQLSDRITIPVMPDDEELGYLVTQAIADFLATANEPPVDGVIFPSVQAKGDARNVVLFHKASRVASMVFPVGTKIEVNDGYATEDGWEQDFSVYETIPPMKSADPIVPAVEPGFGDPPLGRDPDQREPTLSVDPQSVEVHAVEAVQYTTDRNRVRRHRHENVDPPF